MAIRGTYVTQNNTTGETTDPITFETEYDGTKFTWAPGQTRSFADDGQAIGHLAGDVGGTPAAGVVIDDETSKKLNPNQSARS